MFDNDPVLFVTEATPLGSLHHGLIQIERGIVEHGSCLKGQLRVIQLPESGGTAVPPFCNRALISSLVPPLPLLLFRLDSLDFSPPSSSSSASSPSALSEDSSSSAAPPRRRLFIKRESSLVPPPLSVLPPPPSPPEDFFVLLAAAAASLPLLPQPFLCFRFPTFPFFGGIA